MYYKRSQADPCVFRRQRQVNMVIIVVYMHDLLLLSARKGDEKQALPNLRSIFSTKDLGEVSCYLE